MNISSFPKHPWLLAALVIIAFLLAQRLFAAEVLAKIGDTEITMEEIRPLLANLDARERAALAQDPSVLNQAVRSFLVQKVLLKEALAKKWDQQPEVVAQLERARQNAITQSYLLSISQPAESFPGETELKAAYEANKAALLVPKQYQLAQIFLACPAGTSKADAEKVQARLEAVRQELQQAGADFSKIARAESEEKASADRGGEIGWLAETQIQPEIRAKVTGLAKNGISDPIRLNDGWHIIKVVDIKEPYTPAFEDVRQPLAQRLRTERTKANSEAYLATLLQQNPVAINELALADLLKAKP